MAAQDLARWTRFAAKGGIGRCTAIVDCVARDVGDLMFLKVGVRYEFEHSGSVSCSVLAAWLRMQLGSGSAKCQGDLAETYLPTVGYVIVEEPSCPGSVQPCIARECVAEGAPLVLVSLSVQYFLSNH